MLHLSSSTRRQAIVAGLTIAILLSICSEHSWQFSEVTVEEIKMAAGSAEEIPFECIKCDANSIPEPHNKSLCQDEWFYTDQVGDKCSFCEYGNIRSSAKKTVARKILAEQQYDQIYIMGSSTLRHLYLNLVGSFRENHNYTDSTIIEHYFHDHSQYTFNGTNDVFWVQEQSQSLLLNATHSVDFIWNPELLDMNERAFRNWLRQRSMPQKAMMIMGNHFHNSAFHENIPMLVNNYVDYFLNLQGYQHNVVLVWIYTWPIAEWGMKSSTRNKEIEVLNTNARSFFAQQRKKNHGKQQVKYLEIDLEQVMQREFGNKDLAPYYMKEDGIHFMCNFDWPQMSPQGKINTCRHKHPSGHEHCTDPINDLLWKEIYALLSLE
jgi:hypothetical protein